MNGNGGLDDFFRDCIEIHFPLLEIISRPFAALTRDAEGTEKSLYLGLLSLLSLRSLRL
jgi:hypothetical protein